MAQLQIKIDKMSYNGCLIIKDFDLNVAEGEVVAILGPSGAGKTTLLRIIAGLEKNYQGHVKFGQENVCKPRIDIQLLFQDYRLLPWKTVRQNIEFANHNNNCDRGDLQRWLQVMGLTAKQNEWPKTLSGGQVSRVALARTFYAKPRLLLLDEPFQNLDILTKHSITQQLRDIILSERTTTIVVTHTVEDALSLADKIYILDGPPLRTVSQFSISRNAGRLDSTEIAKLTVGINDTLLQLNSKLCPNQMNTITSGN